MESSSWTHLRVPSESCPIDDHKVMIVVNKKVIDVLKMKGQDQSIEVLICVDPTFRASDVHFVKIKIGGVQNVSCPLSDLSLIIIYVAPHSLSEMRN